MSRITSNLIRARQAALRAAYQRELDAPTFPPRAMLAHYPRRCQCGRLLAVYPICSAWAAQYLAVVSCGVHQHTEVTPEIDSGFELRLAVLGLERGRAA